MALSNVSEELKDLCRYILAAHNGSLAKSTGTLHRLHSYLVALADEMPEGEAKESLLVDISYLVGLMPAKQN